MPAAVRIPARARKVAAPNPQNDPRFKRVVEQLKTGSTKFKQHPTPAKKAAEAAAAAKGPPNEKKAGGQAKQVDKIKEAPTKKPESGSFLALLRAEIEKAMPKTLGDTEKFMKGGSAEGMKGSLKGNVGQQKEQAAGDVKSASKQPPSESGVGKQATPIPGEAASAAPAVDGAAAMPAPKPDAEVSLQDSKKDTDQAMKDAEVTDTQLRKANDPRFTAVGAAKGAVAQQSDAAPASYRANEKGALAQAAAKAGADAKKNSTAMSGAKSSSKSAVLTRQQSAKAKDEAARKKVADDIEAIYNETKKNVELKLSVLETDVDRIFDSGVNAALESMKSFVEDRIFKYKLERYLSIPLVGAARWIKDQFLGLPPEVNAFYVEGRNLFTRLMDKVVVQVANLVETRLKEAKQEVANGQTKIKTYVAGLPKNLQSVGQAAQKEVAGRFDELERGIDEKKNQLAQQLADKYKEAFEKADKALKDIQDSNKGLVAAFVEKLGEVIKLLIEFKAKLMAVIKKGEEAIKLVLADPIGFLGNLLAALKQGFNQFVGNIGAHLKKGFMTWLFGELAQSGIAIPSDLSLASILKLVLSVLGLTWERARAEAVKMIGPTAVAVIEKLIEYIQAFWRGGPAALWEKVKEDLSNLKAMVIDAIQDWLITTIVKRAVAKIVTMFNPAGAIVQAVMMIYSVVMFVLERASQIMAFVEAVINSIAAIAKGAIGGAATWIENALGRLVPVVIGLLASLIGLGGIGAKIKQLVTKAGDLVWGAIRKLLKKAIAFIKKMWGKLTGKDKKSGKPEADDGKSVKFKLDVPFNMVSQGHHLYAEAKGGKLVIEMASRREVLESLANRAMNETPNPKAKKRLGNVIEKLKRAEEVARPISDRVADAIAAEKAEKMVRDAANTLKAIGQEFNIPSLQQIPHASQYVQTDVDGFRLKSSHASNIRGQFYPSGYLSATETWFKNRIKKLENPANVGQFKDEMTGKWEPKSQATIDHTTRVVEHWNSNGGNDTTQSGRSGFFNDTTKLQVVTRSNNSSDGAHARNAGLKYEPKVGPNFRGPNE